VIRVGLDTNILACMAGVDRGPLDAGRILAVRQVMRSLKPDVTCLISTQAAGELFVVLGRAGMAREDARATVELMQARLTRCDVTLGVFDRAIAWSVLHKLQLWDAVIISSYVEAGCSIVLSEDLQDGFKLEGATLINPISQPRHPRLQSILI
jgi:predicted nucleic acid-binding protein